LTVDYGGQKIDLKYDKQDKTYKGELTVVEGRKNIDATAEFPGYFNFQSDIYLIEGTEPEPKIIVGDTKNDNSIKEIIPIELKKPRTYHLYTVPKIQDSDKINLSQEELKNFIMLFVPEQNGEPLSENEFKKIKIELDTKLPGKLISGRVRHENKEVMGWIFTPYHYSGYSNHKNAEGTYKLKADLNLSVIKEELEESKTEFLNVSISTKKEFLIEVEKLSLFDKIGAWFWTILSIAIFFIVIVGYIIKERFTPKAKMIIQEFSEDHAFHPKNIEMKASLINRWIPYIKERKIAGGIEFTAKGKMIEMKGKQLSSMFNRVIVKKIIINGELLDKNEIAKKENYKLFNEGKIEIYYENGNSKKYIYHAK
ncbi:MAG: hypothetical protein ACRC6B_02190, partial [Fusobacteriaceae bacterium]